MIIEQRRECRICHCHEKDPCFELEETPIGPRLRRTCSWAGPDLCSFCAADGGPAHLQQEKGPDSFSGLLDRYGEPLRWSKDLPS